MAGTRRDAPPAYCQYETRALIQEVAAGRAEWRDDPAWARSGAVDPEEYAFWAPRACGVACLRSVLASRGAQPPATLPLVRDLLTAGAYRVRSDGGVDGLIYAPFASYVGRRWSIEAEVWPSLTTGGILGALDAGGLVMASVHWSIRHAPDPPAGQGGHLVLVVDHADGDLYVHNPSGLTDDAQRLPVGCFEGFFAGRGIVIRQ